jgi:hypothetical protein
MRATRPLELEDLLEWARSYEHGLVTWIAGADSGLVVHVAADGSTGTLEIDHSRKTLERAVRRFREALLLDDIEGVEELSADLIEALFPEMLLDELHKAVPEDVRVTVVADRGFGDQKLYEYLSDGLGWDYVIRFRESIQVTSAQGETRKARQWLNASGRAKMLRGVAVTRERASVPAVVLVHAKRMKSPWCLATSRDDLTASQVVKLYGKRFSIEETFRDLKDNRFGLGLYATHIGSTKRRDRMLFIAAMAHVLLTMLGAACEKTGLDRMLRANTVKRRTHSLYRQGVTAYGMLLSMPDEWLKPLMEAFGEVILQHQLTSEIFGII